MMDQSSQASNGDESVQTEGMGQMVAITSQTSVLESLGDKRQHSLQEGVEVLSLLCAKFRIDNKEKIVMENIFAKLQNEQRHFLNAVAVFVLQKAKLQLEDETNNEEVGIDEVRQYLNDTKAKNYFISWKMVFDAIQEVMETSDQIDLEKLHCEGLFLVDEDEALSLPCERGGTEPGKGHIESKEWTLAEIEAAMSRPICESDLTPEQEELLFLQDEALIKFRDQLQFE